MTTEVKGKKGRPAGQGAGALNKSQEIRNFFTSHPDSKTQDCIKDLGDRGIVVSQALVAAVRSRLSGKTKTKKEVTLTEVMLVKNFIDKSGLDEDVATSILTDFSDLVIACGGLDRFRDILGGYEGFTHGCAGTVSESISESEATDEAEDSDEDNESDYEDVNDEEDDD